MSYTLFRALRPEVQHRHGEGNLQALIAGFPSLLGTLSWPLRVGNRRRPRSIEIFDFRAVGMSQLRWGESCVVTLPYVIVARLLAHMLIISRVSHFARVVLLLFPGAGLVAFLLFFANDG